MIIMKIMTIIIRIAGTLDQGFLNYGLKYGQLLTRNGILRSKSRNSGAQEQQIKMFSLKFPPGGDGL